jgi:hypothetical protein
VPIGIHPGPLSPLPGQPLPERRPKPLAPASHALLGSGPLRQNLADRYPHRAVLHLPQPVVFLPGHDHPGDCLALKLRKKLLPLFSSVENPSENRRPRTSPPVIARLHELRTSGMTFVQIGAEVGLNQCTVRWLLGRR